MYMKLLSARQRAFFQEVARAAFANPFSEERGAVDRALAGELAAPEDSARVQQMLAALAREMTALERAGLAELGAHKGETREFMRIALLFDAFHRHLAALDSHIEMQLQLGAEPAPASFANRVLEDLKRRGFSAAEALHFLAVFFQLRRAFYFIARGLKGNSASMRLLRERLWQNLFTRDIRWYDRYLSDRMEDFSTLLLGGTGSGKGAAAAAIGRSGFIPFDPRRGRFKESFTRAFIAINLSQFPETLVESELFGHRKGSFTGAVEHYEGILARCSPHGAILLDEVGDVAPPLQLKLLRVLQERQFTPVGSHEPQRFRGRVIAATNQPIEALRRDGRFRDDFYYRLCSDVIEVPSLAARLRDDTEDLDLLTREIVRRIIGQDAAELADDVRNRIVKAVGPQYPWPGNVRELEQAIRQILLTGGYTPQQNAAPQADAALVAAWESGTLTATELLAAYCRHLHDQFGTYEEVARRTRLDRRTVKKYTLAIGAKDGGFR